MLKNWIKRTLVASGATRLAAQLNGQGVAILMYHSVMDDPSREANTLDGIENAKLPWPSRLRYAFYTTKKNNWNESNGTIWPLKNFGERDRAFLKACDDCCHLAGDAQEQFVRGIERELEAAPSATTGSPMMTWDQVRGLVQKGHIVGSH